MNKAALWPSSVLRPKIEDHTQLIDRVLDRIDELRPNTKGVTINSLDRERESTIWLVEALFQATSAFPPVALALPRSPNDYGSTRSKTVKLSYRAVTRVLDALIALEWVRCEPGFQTTDSGQVSRYWADGELLAYCKNRGQAWREMIPPSPDSLILISDKPNGMQRRPVEDNEGPEVSTWRKNLQRINELLLSKCVMLDATDELIIEISTFSLEKQLGSRRPQTNRSKATKYVVPLQFHNVTLRRIFARGRLDFGGRFYGGWWMHVPSRFRRNIIIDDESTVECDFSGIALRCLYAQEGLDIGTQDPYDIGLPDYKGRTDPRRRIVKEYVNAALNDVDNRYVVGSKQLRTLGLTGRELHTLVQQRHRQVFHHFHTGIGLNLQYVDSRIAEAVMLRFADMNEAVLPIHDSFIVRKRMHSHLTQIMEEEFKRITGQPSTLTTDNELPERTIGGPLGWRQVSESPSNKVVETWLDRHDRCQIGLRYLGSWSRSRATIPTLPDWASLASRSST